MGSINDYLKNRQGGESSNRGKGRGSRIRNRLLGQVAVSLVLFLVVAASIGADSIFGSSARYVMGDGIAYENSWIDFQQQENAAENDTTTPKTDTDGQVQNVFPADDSAQPDFTAPASGIVVTDIAVSTGGFASSQGILIQGNSGQTVKAAAAGQVSSLNQNEDGYLLELAHNGGFSSVYQGLSQVTVQADDQVSLADQIGVTATGELTFSMYLNGVEVNPLDYLFE